MVVLTVSAKAYSKSVPALFTLKNCNAVPLANLTNLVPLLFNISPAAVPVSVIVLLVAFIVLFVSVIASDDVKYVPEWLWLTALYNPA